MSEHACKTACGCAAPASSTTSTGAAKSGAIQNGKGDAPRNISTRFRKNYDGIRWTSAGKDRKEGSRFTKVYA